MGRDAGRRGSARRSVGRSLVCLMASAALVAGVMVAAAVPAGAAPAWSVSTSPKPAGPPLGGLSSVSCGSPTSCFAVGATRFSTTLIEHWNGTIWSAVTSPKVAGVDRSALAGVSCAAAATCVAVGFSVTGSVSQTLVERLSGTTWSVIASPSPSGTTRAVLNSVSCLNTTDCWAVGSSGSGSVDKPLVEHVGTTNHVTRATIFPATNPPGKTESHLDSVVCLTTVDCMAVGAAATTTTTKTLVEQWTGTQWQILTSPNPTGTTRSRLAGVSCVTTTSCDAVGISFPVNGDDATIAEHWNGTSWTIVATPAFAAGSGGGLSGVMCESASSCFAVGAAGPTLQDNNILAEHWDGTSWTIVASPVPAGAYSSDLAGIDCPSATRCLAVGTALSSALLELWNGTSWSIAPAPTGTTQSTLAQVACTSTTSCFAVGQYFNGSATRTLVARWNGTSWATMGSANPPGAGESGLLGIACPTATSCVAVGYTGPISARTTLVERWNGTSWAIDTSPNPTGATESVLAGVACPTATSCYAVGHAGTSSGGTMLIEHWDGTNWSIQASPGPAGALRSLLSGVTCASDMSCFAVGAYSTSSTAKTLVERWNGSTWSAATSANPAGATAPSLNGVSCASSTSCFAVGNALTGTVTKTLVERWNGIAWTIVTSASPAGAVDSRLFGASCPSTTSCYAAGFTDTSTVSRVLIERWNGTSWVAMVSQTPTGSIIPILSGITCRSSISCFAVGDDTTQKSDATLIERYA
jgi:hypothetical protein